MADLTYSAREVYSIPEGYDPVAARLLYRRSTNLPERLLQRVLAPRSRKPLEKFVFSSSWNQASPLVRSQD